MTASTFEKPAKARKRIEIPVWALLLAAAVLALGAVPVALLAGNDGSKQEARADTAENRSSAVASAAAPVAATIDDLCRQGTPLAADLAARGACAQAEKAKEVITEQPLPAASVPGLSPAQIQIMISDALADLPKPITIEQVAAKATEIYAAQDVSTPERIKAAVTTYCANDACIGPAGKNATDAQVSAQVNAYCASREDKCVGPPGADGKPGPAGVSFQRQYFQRDANGACLSYVESFDPVTGNTSTATSPAGDAACPAPPPAAPTSSSTPGG